MTTPRRTGTTRTRISGSGTAIAPWMKWRTPGSTSSISTTTSTRRSPPNAVRRRPPPPTDGAVVKRLVTLCAAGVLAGGALVLSQQPPEPRKQFGASVTGAFEGWFTNKDGSRAFLVGYYNRNSRQELDVPIGPDNRIEPGGPDMGQPTHFLPGRQFGM